MIPIIVDNIKLKKLKIWINNSCEILYALSVFQWFQNLIVKVGTKNFQGTCSVFIFLSQYNLPLL